VAAALAAATAPVAAVRLGALSALPFIAVAALATVLATSVARRVPTALVISTVLLGGQILAAVGAALELDVGVAASKADQLDRLGVDPRLGVAINLVFSLTGGAIFLWAMWRLARQRRAI
jgi:hypothetical protein